MSEYFNFVRFSGELCETVGWIEKVFGTEAIWRPPGSGIHCVGMKIILCSI